MDSLHEPPVFQKAQFPTPPPFPTEKGPKQRIRLRVPARLLVPVLVVFMAVALGGLMQTLLYDDATHGYDRILEGPRTIEWGKIDGGNFSYEVEFRPQRTDPTAVVSVYFLKSDDWNYYQLTVPRRGEVALYFVENGIRTTLPLSGFERPPNFDNGIEFRIVRSLGDDIQVYVGGNIVHYSVNPSAKWGSFGIEQHGDVVAGYRVSLREQM